LEGRVTRGRLIAFEGIDGAGKTTQAEMLAAALRTAGRTVVVTKEPTDGPAGQKIRELSTAGADITPEEELKYFIEDRTAHVRDVLLPGIDRGDVVISDRYFLSNVAYQGARGLAPADVLTKNEALFPHPDAVILLEVPPQEGLRRVEARGGTLNLAYERVDFLQRASQIFGAIDRAYIHRIDGAPSPDEVHDKVRRSLAGLLDLNLDLD
jgi:dTMP kinase